MLEKIVGHRRQREYFKHLIETSALLHAYLLEGVRGIGKKMLALEIAGEILCTNEKERSLFELGNFSDFLMIRTEGAEIRVEEVKQVQEFLLSAPAIAEKKIIVIDDAEKMNLHAQNKILKLVEEPPSYAIFFFICSHRESLLPTLRSRLITVSFNALNPEEMRDFVEKRNLIYDEKFAALSAGSAGSYLELLGELDGSAFDLIFRLKDALKSRDQRALFDSILAFEERKNDLIRLLGAMEDLSSEFLDFHETKGENPERDASRLARYLRIVAEARYRVERNQHKELIISNLIYRLQGVFE